MQFDMKRRVLAGVIAAGVIVTLAGCGNQQGQAGSTGGASANGGDLKIALLLPENKTTRYEAQDRPNFEADVKKLDPSITVVYNNANQDATQQQQQAEAALTDGANVLVIDPVDASALGSVLQKAKAKKVPVISYDRFFEGADYYTSFNNEKIGELQGQAVLDGLKAKGVDATSGPIWMVNGDPKDPNAADFKSGAEKVLKAAGVDITATHDTLDWNPDDARQWVEGQLNSGSEKPIAIYSANDGTAGGVIAAAQKAGVDPVVTGQDGEVDGLQNILRGLQYATIYKAYAPQAEFAATAAVALAQGKEVQAKDTYKDVPTDFVDAQVITKDNLKDVFTSGQTKESDVCTGDAAALCTAAGISG
ncbi:sugar ABC transporter substrate-binding protein [Okibacterium fritillariae]|uniref:D-xylose transport system substrate-binding protein n=1 Tax=Okibacterium fritillariae TaxID=123320 RepID=A0A1T5IY96_9MICO|nr:substrate-binding domain-containing protein [Okibacterium fritillariae]SKC44140.1 D-xylose transport system substrate-binding protein [Okibacterium fritillariae]